MARLLTYAASTLLLYALACTSTPTEPGFDNPLNPGDPNYEPPLTTITSGPSEGAVIDSHAVTFSWEGNQEKMEFTYRLNGREWSEWKMITTITYQYLDDGHYTFELKGRYLSGIEEDGARSRNYTIDDIHGPALWLYPRYQQVSLGGTITLEIILEEVANVIAVKAAIIFDPTKLRLTDIDIYEDSRSLLKSTDGAVIAFSSYDHSTGLVIINVATAIGTPAGVTGSGAIAKLSLTASGSELITFNIGTSLRDANNNEITISELANSLVDVQ